MLRQDLQKWDSEKTRLESRVVGLVEDKKNLSTTLSVLETNKKNLLASLEAAEVDLREGSGGSEKGYHSDL